MIRNGWKRGDYLVKDDMSGFTEYASDCAFRYDGIMFKRSGNEDEIPRHPQEFVRALNDPRALQNTRPQVHSPAVSQNIGAVYANGPTLVQRGGSAAIHLYLVGTSGIGTIVKDVGIVENPFIVASD